MQVVDRLPQHTSPKILTRAFRSGLRVVHTPWYTHKEFASRLLILLRASGPKTTIQVANQENVSIGLIQEMITSVEEEGRIVQDEAANGNVLWWPNEIVSFVWDGD